MRSEQEEIPHLREHLQHTLVESMSRRDFLRLGGVGLVCTALSMVPGLVDPDSIAVANAATTNIALGAFAPSLPWSFDDIDRFSDLVGRKQSIIHWFQDWAMDFNPTYTDAAVAREGVPLVSWEPWKFGEGLEQPAYALKRIIGGDHDSYIRRWAQAAAAWGKPFYLRFAHEMNSDWTSWSPGVNGNTTADFVSAWRKVWSIFRQEGATNAKWVWSPVAHYEGATPYKKVYPGETYVNWVGISGYNWGDTRAWSHWQSFSEIFSNSYKQVRAITRKPIMIPEVASAESGGDKAAWIRNAFLKDIPSRFPRIRAVVWFHANKENDWRVDSSPSALEAYREVVASTRYQRSPL